MLLLDLFRVCLEVPFAERGWIGLAEPAGWQSLRRNGKARSLKRAPRNLRSKGGYLARALSRECRTFISISALAMVARAFAMRTSPFINKSFRV